jgi:lon-related putative ATP-dependent protease
LANIDPLPAKLLYQVCDLSKIDFETTEQLPILDEIIGQDRARESIAFGTGIKHQGYHLYVMGSSGVGRHWMVNNSLQRLRRSATMQASDWCYVGNFDNPNQPLAIRLPPGMGRRLRNDLTLLVESLLDAIPVALQSEEFSKQVEEISHAVKQREERMAAEFDRKSREQGIALLHTPTGYTLVPIKQGKVVSPEAFEQLPEEEQQAIEALVESLHDELRSALSKIPIWKRDMRQRIKAVEREFAQLTLDQLMQEVFKKYADYPDMSRYLEALHEDVMQNLDLFRTNEDEQGNPIDTDDPRFIRYRVNLLVDNQAAPAVPIVYEPNPTYQNLLGRIEHYARMGTLVTDFTLIKPGALHRANDGYLVLDAEKVLTNPFSWEALKRTLKSQEMRIESLERQLSLMSTITLEPDPIPVNLKVILIGDRQLYHLLKAYDADFGQLFKVVADLAETLPRVAGNDLKYAHLIATLQQQEGLLPITREGVQRIIEQSARRAQDADKLSLHMGSLLDLLEEADFWAAQDESPRIEGQHVQQALDHQTRRLSQLWELLQEEILEGNLMIDTSGRQLGRVNGLSVVQAGDLAFGMPTRISATARLGSGEMVDIEREVEQGGPIHSKGVFILSAYINRRYARYQPLSLAATLVFEQTYAEVEGDSASAAELCALLSALGDIPLRQDLAITGSVNQHGEMQPIGGVCEKIEGFFDICAMRGLTGQQGVIIPYANRHDLMLKQALVDAVRAAKFHVFAVKHVEQAMELLSGLDAGVANERGVYPDRTINGMVQQRLAEWLAIRLDLAHQEKLEN